MTINRTKIIKRIGDSAGIILNKEERQMFGLDIGDVIELKFKKVHKPTASKPTASKPTASKPADKQNSEGVR